MQNKEKNRESNFTRKRKETLKISKKKERVPENELCKAIPKENGIGF